MQLSKIEIPENPFGKKISLDLVNKNLHEFSYWLKDGKYQFADDILIKWNHFLNEFYFKGSSDVEYDDDIQNYLYGVLIEANMRYNLMKKRETENNLDNITDKENRQQEQNEVQSNKDKIIKTLNNLEKAMINISNSLKDTGKVFSLKYNEYKDVIASLYIPKYTNNSTKTPIVTLEELKKLLIDFEKTCNNHNDIDLIIKKWKSVCSYYENCEVNPYQFDPQIKKLKELLDYKIKCFLSNKYF